jgi:hypothetical protein
MIIQALKIVKQQNTELICKHARTHTVCFIDNLLHDEVLHLSSEIKILSSIYSPRIYRGWPTGPFSSKNIQCFPDRFFNGPTRKNFL